MKQVWVATKIRSKKSTCSSETPGVVESLADTRRAPWTNSDRIRNFGVIGSITPCTNPTETILNNGIGMLAAGNTVVFNTHPNAKVVSAWYIDLLNKAIEDCGGPPNIFNCVAKPTIESAGDLMKHPLIRLLVVTGGGGVVKAAMASGKRAIAAGPGNPPVVVDETADIQSAGRDIVFGASLDNNIICIVEKEIIVVNEVADALKRTMEANHAVELRGRDIKKLEKLLITDDNHVNRDYIGKDAALILADAGIRVPDSTRLAFAEVEESHPFVQHEMLMPVVGLVRAPTVDEAIDCAVRVEHVWSYGGHALHKYPGVKSDGACSEHVYLC